MTVTDNSKAIRRAKIKRINYHRQTESFMFSTLTEISLTKIREGLQLRLITLRITIMLIMQGPRKQR